VAPRSPATSATACSTDREADGPQFVTKHGQEVAVIVSIAEYRHLRNEGEDFKAFLASAPDVELEISRPDSPAPRVVLGEEA
jgi:hypothetical protein